MKQCNYGATSWPLARQANTEHEARSTASEARSTESEADRTESEAGRDEGTCDEY